MQIVGIIPLYQIWTFHKLPAFKIPVNNAITSAVKCAVLELAKLLLFL